MINMDRVQVSMIQLNNTTESYIMVNGIKKINAVMVRPSKDEVKPSLVISYETGELMIYLYDGMRSLLVDVSRLGEFYRFSEDDFKHI